MATRSHIPKIIHQTWETLDVPEIWKEAEREWRRFCSENNYEYKLWTADDRRALVADKFSWYLPTFDALKMNVQRADAWRYFALYVYGGIYIDLDFVPKHTNIKALLNYYNTIEASVVIAKSATSGNFKGEVLTNACMMSEKEAPYWKVVWEELKQPLSKGTVSRRLLRHIPYFQVIFGTGPGRINIAMQKYLKMDVAKTHPFVMIPAEFISCGFEWEKKPFETQESAVKLLAGSSWHTKSMRVYRHISRVMSQSRVIYIVIICVLAIVVLLLMIFLILAKKKNRDLKASMWFPADDKI